MLAQQLESAHCERRVMTHGSGNPYIATYYLFTPGATKAGLDRITDLAARQLKVLSNKHLVGTPVDQVYCGIGVRFLQMAEALGLVELSFDRMDPTPKGGIDLKMSALFGSAAIQEDQHMILLSGPEIPKSMCTTARDMKPTLEAKLLSGKMEDHTVICGDEEIVKILDSTQETKRNACCYQIFVHRTDGIRCTLIGIGPP